MSQFILAEVLAPNLHKRIHLHICIKPNKAVTFPFPGWLDLGRLVMDGSIPNLSASRGRIPSGTVDVRYHMKGGMWRPGKY